MRKDESIAIEMIKAFRKLVPNTGYVVVEADVNMPFSGLKAMKDHARKYRMKRFHIQDIVPISNNTTIPMIWNPTRTKYGKKYGLEYEDATGMFKLMMSDGSVIIFTCIITGYGASKRLERYIATDKPTMLKWLKCLERRKKHNQKPKNGFYQAFTIEGLMQYAKVVKKASVPIVHDAILQLDKDIDFFFNNNNLFTRYGMPGTRKAMLIGPPGTGKTSMCIRLALKRSNDMPIVVAQDIQSLAKHLQSCSKYKIPTIIIIEDAESILNDTGSGSSSGILNFLDGLNQPVNKKGAYVIMTTNHPNRIEPRIIKRPGRIDKIISVGPLEGIQAMECAKIYLNNEYKGDWEDIKPIVNGMTGAQIKELAQSCFAYAAQNQLELNKETVNTVKNRLTEDLSDAYKYAEDNTISNKARSLGFFNTTNQHIRR